MSVKVCLSTNQTLNYPQGGGHLWVYLNWALGLRALGCEVIWLETISHKESALALNRRRRLEPDGRLEHDLLYEVRANVGALKRRLERYGLAERLALHSCGGEALPDELTEGCLDLEAAAEADLLLNLRYNLPGEVVERFRRSALLDIDPGLLQLWMSEGSISVPRHDLYFTIGETVGRPGARFPDAGLEWHYTPPPVYLPEWPPVRADEGAPYTTVSHWWGDEWIKIQGEYRENNSSGPDHYRSYIQQSRGEFSCVKPSCVWLENAWISDRTLCYLASAKPAVVHKTRVPAASCLTRKASFGSGTWKRPAARSLRWSRITSGTAGLLASWLWSTSTPGKSLEECWSVRWHE